MPAPEHLTVEKRFVPGGPVIALVCGRCGAEKLLHRPVSAATVLDEMDHFEVEHGESCRVILREEERCSGS